MKIDSNSSDPIRDPQFLDRLINEAQAADIIGYTVSALRNWRIRGGGPKFVKTSNRAVRYRIRNLIEWMDEHTISNTSQYTQ